MTEESTKGKRPAKFDIFFGRPVKFTFKDNHLAISDGSPDNERDMVLSRDDKRQRMKEGSKWILFSFIGLVIAMMFIAPPDSFIYKRPVQQTNLDRSYYYNLHLIKQDISDSSKTFDIKMRLLSQSFSAQVPITIQDFQIRQIRGENYTGTLMVIFPRANEVSDSQKDDQPGVFESTQGANLIIDAPKDGFYFGKSDSGEAIRYDMQGCYNVVVITNTTRIVDRQLFQPDCTEINIASLDATTALKLDKQNLDIQNLVIEQNNLAIRISAFALMFSLFSFVVGVCVNYMLQK